MILASKSNLGSSKLIAIKMCINADVGPPCVQSAFNVPPLASCSSPSCGVNEHCFSDEDASLIPSLAKFPTYIWKGKLHRYGLLISSSPISSCTYFEYSRCEKQWKKNENNTRKDNLKIQFGNWFNFPLD